LIGADEAVLTTAAAPAAAVGTTILPAAVRRAGRRGLLFLFLLFSLLAFSLALIERADKKAEGGEGATGDPAQTTTRQPVGQYPAQCRVTARAPVRRRRRPPSARR
jgi:hypothetical protein